MCSKWKLHIGLGCIVILFNCCNKLNKVPQPPAFSNVNDCRFLKMIGEGCISEYTDSSLYLICTIGFPPFVDSSLIISIKKIDTIYIGSLKRFGGKSQCYIHNDTTLFNLNWGRNQRVEYSTIQLKFDNKHIETIRNTLNNERFYNLPEIDSLNLEPVFDGISVSIDLSDKNLKHCIYRRLEKNMPMTDLIRQLLKIFNQNRALYFVEMAAISR